MNIIITGVSGFVGTNLKEHLSQNGYHITGLSLRSDNYNIDNEATAIIHLAGKAHDTKNSTNDEEYFQINTQLTKDIFDQFLISAIPDFIFISSVKAVADTVDDVLTEDTIPNPQTAYGKSKLAAEQYILSHHIPDNKRVFIIRPCMIHGKGNKGNLNLLYNIVKKGIPWPLAAFDNKRSFLYIENLQFLIAAILQNKNIEGGIYNFADDDYISTNQLISIMALSLQKNPKLLKINPTVIKYVAKLGDVIHSPLNTERLQKLTEDYIVSNTKIKKALNIKNLPFSTTQGIEQSIKFFTLEK